MQKKKVVLEKKKTAEKKIQESALLHSAHEKFCLFDTDNESLAFESQVKASE